MHFLKVDYVLQKTRITLSFVALTPDLFVENFQIGGMNCQKYNDPLLTNWAPITLIDIVWIIAYLRDFTRHILM